MGGLVVDALEPQPALLYNSDMRAATTVSITLPVELLSKAQELAERDHSSVSEVVQAALAGYIGRDPEWDSLLMQTRQIGRELGVNSEEDVERLSDQWRRERRS